MTTAFRRHGGRPEAIALPSRRLVILRIITCVRAISIFPARYAVYECLAELLAQGYPDGIDHALLAQDARKDTGVVSRNYPVLRQRQNIKCCGKA